MTKDIIFTNTKGNLSIDKPILASKLIPDWYKNTKSYLGDEKIPSEDHLGYATVKKCIPVFDAITSGYIISTTAEIYISTKEGELVYQWAANDELDFHPVQQAELHPSRNPKSLRYPKFMNPWSIKTPKGYSCLFLQPMHRDLPFQVLPAIVDTDTYTAPVNIIFSLKDPNFEGYIPIGTPIAQVIPFKRDSWQMKDGNEETLQKAINDNKKIHTRFYDKYKHMFWHRKEYK